MTVSTTTNKISYAGVSTQDRFAYNFRVDEKSDMEVYFGDVLQPDGDWTITNLTNPAGGDVILNTPLVENTTVVLLRNVPQTQNVDYQPFDAFPAETHEGALDKLTFITQQNDEKITRNAQLKIDTALDGLPIEEPIANKILIYNASGDEIVSGGDAPAGTTSGIDDNTTKVIMDLMDTIMLLGSLATEFNIAKVSKDSLLDISGGTPDDGGSISLFGSTHGLSPGDVNLRSSANVFFLLDESTGILTILTGIGSKTLAVTFNADQSVDFAGNISSLGFADIATGERLLVTDSLLGLGTSGSGYGIARNVNNRNLSISGGTSNIAGGNIQLFGGTNVSSPGDVQLLSNNELFLNWDESVGELEILTGIGAKTSALTINANQVIVLLVGQIKFPATQNASSDANTLDDYEEGTFTPTLQDNSFSDSESQGYTTQTGTYTKIGNRVFFSIELKMNDLGTLLAGSGAHIGNLPFTAAADEAVYVGQGSGLSLPVAGQNVAGETTAGTTRIALRLWDITPGTTALLISEITAVGGLFISGHYRV